MSNQDEIVERARRAMEAKLAKSHEADELHMPARAEARTAVREGPVAARSGEYRTRSGRMVRRDPAPTANPYDFPNELKEEGWDYQWIRAGTYGSTDGDMSEMAVMHRAGWEEVHPDALNGYFRDQVPAGQNHIRVGDLILVERPVELTQEARAEHDRKTHALMSAQMHKRHDESPLPSGYVAMARQIDMDGPEPAPSDFKPRYQRPKKAV